MKEFQVIPLLDPADHQSTGAELDSINMGKLHRVKVLIQLGAVTGDNPIALVYAGATAGAKTTELAFKHRKSGADTGAAGADVFGARTAQAADGVGAALGAATAIDHRVFSIDVEADQMPEGKPWLTVVIDDGSASGLLMSAVAIGTPRYSGDTHQTAL